MRRSIIVLAFIIPMVFALLGNLQTAGAAAPALQLPWRHGQKHLISGGYTYDCGTHVTDPATGGAAYNADKYAIDFQYGFPDAPSLDVTAVAGGLVLVAGNQNDGYGNKVVVDHGQDASGNHHTSTYAHLASISGSVAPIQTVTQNQYLGDAGNTGTIEVHLHFHMMLGLNAYKAEPMSGWGGAEQDVNGFGHRFGWYGVSNEYEFACGDPGNVSPYFTSGPPDDDGDGFSNTVEERIGTSASARCDVGPSEPSLGWPLDFIDPPNDLSANSLWVTDLGTFIYPVRRYGPPGAPTFYHTRWDLNRSAFSSGVINAQDFGAFTAGLTGNPPMFDGRRPMTKTCTAHPVLGD